MPSECSFNLSGFLTTSSSHLRQSGTPKYFVLFFDLPPPQFALCPPLPFVTAHCLQHVSNGRMPLVSPGCTGMPQPFLHSLSMPAERLGLEPGVSAPVDMAGDKVLADAGLTPARGQTAAPPGGLPSRSKSGSVSGSGGAFRSCMASLGRRIHLL
mmetsp:Transcript_51908/g.123559  ORF Transcript_51908/g.123559 Transcript_51908/m.123559 type:complete len:155 (+) Transcript_51908:1824-2288(+)